MAAVVRLNEMEAEGLGGVYSLRLRMLWELCEVKFCGQQSTADQEHIPPVTDPAWLMRQELAVPIVEESAKEILYAPPLALFRVQKKKK